MRISAEKEALENLSMFQEPQMTTKDTMQFIEDSFRVKKIDYSTFPKHDSPLEEQVDFIKKRNEESEGGIPSRYFSKKGFSQKKLDDWCNENSLKYVLVIHPNIRPHYLIKYNNPYASTTEGWWAMNELYKCLNLQRAKGGRDYEMHLQ